MLAMTVAMAVALTYAPMRPETRPIFRTVPRLSVVYVSLYISPASPRSRLTLVPYLRAVASLHEGETALLTYLHVSSRYSST